MAIVGSGDFRYERVAEWPKMPKYWAFGAASDGAVNSKDEVYIFSRGLHPLTIWSADGDFISSWGEGTFSANPHGIYIAPNDNVWLVDRDFHTAVEYTPGGEVLRTLGEKLAPSPSFQGLPFNMPSGLAIAPDGCLFVSDGYGGHRVHKFSADGELIKSWGKQGTGPGEFALLHNIWVDKNSRVYIADRENNRMQLFTDEGEFIEEWTDMTAPGDLWIHDDVIYVIEQGGGNGVSIWTIDGELIKSWGKQGTGPGEFALLHNIWVDKNSRVYIADRENNRMQLFTDEGEFIEEWTDMTAPGDLWIHDDVIYVIEQGGGNGVSIWTIDGDLITRWRGNEGAGMGTLIGGHGICVDSKGSIYVTEIGQGERVSKFVRV